MVIKTDGFRTNPPKVRSQWVDLLSCFLNESPEGSVEDYLSWCGKKVRLSAHRSRMVKRVEANPYFKQTVAAYRCFVGVEPEAMRSMSARWLQESDILDRRGELWYREMLLGGCKRFSLSAAWQDFLESHILFNDGSAGYALLRSPVVDYGTSRETGLLIIAYAIDVYVDMSEVREPISPIVTEAQKALYGVAGSKLRSLDFYELDERYLFCELADTYGKSYKDIISMVERCRRTGMIDPAIRRIYPDKSQDDIVKFLRNLSDFYLTYEGVHSAVRHTRDGFERHYRAPTILAGEF